MATSEFTSMLSWSFIREVSVPEDVKEMLIDGETAICAFATIRDVAIFTDKRLIVRDAQGITGKKVEIYTLPYSSIVMYSSENAGKILDFDTEIELWLKNGHIKINLKKGIDIRKIDKILANAILK